MTETQHIEIPPHLQRMAGESAVLVERKQRLSHFIHGGVPAFEALPDEEKTLLRAQLGAMESYARILQIRLERALLANSEAQERAGQ